MTAEEIKNLNRVLRNSEEHFKPFDLKKYENIEQYDKKYLAFVNKEKQTTFENYIKDQDSYSFVKVSYSLTKENTSDLEVKAEKEKFNYLFNKEDVLIKLKMDGCFKSILESKKTDFLALEDFLESWYINYKAAVTDFYKEMLKKYQQKLVIELEITDALNNTNLYGLISAAVKKTIQSGALISCENEKLEVSCLINPQLLSYYFYLRIWQEPNTKDYFIILNPLRNIKEWSSNLDIAVLTFKFISGTKKLENLSLEIFSDDSSFNNNHVLQVFKLLDSFLNK